MPGIIRSCVSGYLKIITDPAFQVAFLGPLLAMTVPDLAEHMKWHHGVMKMNELVHQFSQLHVQSL